jgi:hypothetical protein
VRSLLDPRLWLAFLLALALTNAGSYLRGRSDGKRLQQQEYASAIAKANAMVAAESQRRQAAVDKALADAASRESRIRADALGARRQLDGMRGTLDAVERASKASSDAAAKSVAALSDVFEQCSRRYQELAEVADRHANDSLTLQRSWPK